MVMDSSNGVEEDQCDAESYAMLQSKANIQNNVIVKRKEQLKHWESSEMNKLAGVRRPVHQARVKFHDSDIFLSACVSGDEEEVEELLFKGANINVGTIDGVTALHQAVIDDKLAIVKFLVDHKANINAQDNEGWTPLHAAVCCGSLPIAKYLCEQGADFTLINSDKELPVDLAKDEAIRDYLEALFRSRSLDMVKCREQEFALIMRDCAEWSRSGRYSDRPHPRTGASALHVAASKGYNQLIGMLIRAGADVQHRDAEGWAPLHAAAHWGERDACRILMENGARLDALTNQGQAVKAVAADAEVVAYLEELERKMEQLRRDALTKVVAKSPSSASTVSSMASTTSTASTASTAESGSSTAAAATAAVKPKAAPPVPPPRTAAPGGMPGPFPTARAALAQMEDDGATTEDEQSTETVEDEEEDEDEEYTEEDEELSAETVTGSTSSSEKAVETKQRAAATPKEGSASLHSSDQNVECTIRVPQQPPPLSSPLLASHKQVLQSNASQLQSGALLGSPGATTVRGFWVAANANNSQFAKSRQQFILGGHSASLEKAGAPLARISSPSASDSTGNSPSPSPAGAMFKKPLTPPTQPSPAKESESMRRNNSRQQRHSRRSTQGVTSEQVSEAAKQAAAAASSSGSSSSATSSVDDMARWKSATLKQQSSADADSSSELCTDCKKDTHPAPPAPKWRTRAAAADLDEPVGGKHPGGVHASACLKLPPALPNASATLQLPLQAVAATESAATPSAAKLSRRSQVVRGSRRGTGPVDMDALLAAADGQRAPAAVPAAPPKKEPPPVAAKSSAAVNPPPADPVSHSSTASSCAQPDAASGGGGGGGAAFRNFKTLFENECEENRRLRKRVDELNLKLARQAVPANGDSNGAGSSSVSHHQQHPELNDKERRTFERRIAALEYELEAGKLLKLENGRLKTENEALIRVLSKISRPDASATAASQSSSANRRANNYNPTTRS